MKLFSKEMGGKFGVRRDISRWGKFKKTEHRRKTIGRFGCEVRCLASSEREKR